MNTKVIITADDQTREGIESVKAGMAGLGPGLTVVAAGAAAVAAALAEMTRQSVMLYKDQIRVADSMDEMSVRMAMSIKDMVAWQAQAEMNGTSLEAMATGTRMLAKHMTEHGEALKKAGITSKDANEAFLQLSDLFKGMTDPVARLDLATRLFGRGVGQQLLPALVQGREGLEEIRRSTDGYGEALTRLAPEAQKLNDTLYLIGIEFKRAAAEGVYPMVRDFNEMLLPAFRDAGKEGAGLQEYLISPLVEGLRAVAVLGFNVAFVFKGIRTEIGGVAAQAAALGRGDFKAVAAIREAMVADAEQARKDFDKIEAMMMRAGLNGGATSSGGSQSMMLPGANSRSEADETAAVLAERLSKRGNGRGTRAGKKAEIFGPELPYYVAAALKEEAAFNKRAESFIEQHEARAEMYRIETEGEEAVREAMEKTADEAAKESWKASQKSAKKAAEDATKSWENFTRDLESSLTDALMRSFEAGDSFGEAFADNLKNIFKTMLLKAAVQITVGTVAGSAQQALGINVGGAGGGSSVSGALNLLSTGQSLYGAFTGGTAASLGGMIGGSFGAGMQGASLAAGLAGPTTAGATGAMGAGAMAATAIPYVAVAVAVASILGGMFKNKVAPIEWGLRDTPLTGYNLGGGWDPYGEQGPFTRVTTLGQHLSRNGQSPASLKTAVTDPVVALDNILAGYLSATEKVNVSMGLMLGNEGEQGWSHAAVEGIMMRRLNRISDAIGGWVDKLADTTTGNLQERYTQLAQILSIRGDAEVEKLANDMFNATGKWSYDQFAALQAGVARFDDMFKTDADRLADYTAAMQKAFGSLNVALPESRDGFKALVEGIDTSTKSGFDLYATLLELSPTMGAYYDALNQELDVKKKLAGMAESSFATAVDYRRYQGVAANYDQTFAGDYAYNIRLGAIKPGSAANGDIVSELRALRAEQQAQSLAIATNTQDTAKLLRRWNGDGMPETRVVA